MRKQGLGEGLAQRPTAEGGRARAGGPPVTVRSPGVPFQKGPRGPAPCVYLSPSVAFPPAGSAPANTLGLRAQSASSC